MSLDQEPPVLTNPHLLTPQRSRVPEHRLGVGVLQQKGLEIYWLPKTCTTKSTFEPYSVTM